MLISHYYGMGTEFWNRRQELARIQRWVGKGSFGYVTGRRRIGKTAILKEACRAFGGCYHQAVEGTPPQQLLHLCEELGDSLPLFKDIQPKSWGEFFKLLKREKLPPLIVFDEFPYWAASDNMLPSLLQKWIDHELPKRKTLLMVSGSSQSMLFSHFLNKNFPLYGRSSLHLNIPDMNYRWFCKVLHYDMAEPESFQRYCLVGGVPHYWKLLPKTDLIQQAEELYFEPVAALAEEPIQLLRDEGMSGTVPKAILDFIGRGVAKPSALASRIGTVQGNLTRPLAMLLQLGLIQRDLPFGESTRTTKKVFYRLVDAPLSFYYGSFLPMRSRWQSLSSSEKKSFLHRHAAGQWEHFCRQAYPGSARYWDKAVEIDMIAPLKGNKYLAAECKWKKLSAKEEKTLSAGLREKFYETGLAQKHWNITFRIFSQKDLHFLADRYEM